MSAQPTVEAGIIVLCTPEAWSGGTALPLATAAPWEGLRAVPAGWKKQLKPLQLSQLTDNFAEPDEL